MSGEKEALDKGSEHGPASNTNAISSEEMDFHVSQIAEEGRVSILHPFNLCRAARGKDCSRDRFRWVKRAKGNSGGQE